MTLSALWKSNKSCEKYFFIKIHKISRTSETSQYTIFDIVWDLRGGLEASKSIEIIKIQRNWNAGRVPSTTLLVTYCSFICLWTASTSLHRRLSGGGGESEFGSECVPSNMMHDGGTPLAQTNLLHYGFLLLDVVEPKNGALLCCSTSGRSPVEISARIPQPPARGLFFCVQHDSHLRSSVNKSLLSAFSLLLSVFLSEHACIFCV